MMGMFPEPETQYVSLSKSLVSHRLRDGETARWGKLSLKKARPCQECIALQYETKGAFGPRRNAKVSRTVANLHLDLCSAHAQLWSSLDEQGRAA